MTDQTFAVCESCPAEGTVELPPVGTLGPLLCPICHGLMTIVDIEPWRAAVEARVQRKAALVAGKALGTRRQSRRQSDTAIDRDGLEAELAACLLLCPGYRAQWLESGGPNRGADLPAAWTLLGKPVEVKATRHYSGRHGHLLVRPPRWTPGAMRPAYIEDCLYVLMLVQGTLQTLLGWTDRKHFLTHGALNPVPVHAGQRECWGIHWSHLLRPRLLVRLLPTPSNEATG